jgi:predicted SnoaL-like aldol condensation-catalyzing enzyme
MRRSVLLPLSFGLAVLTGIALLGIANTVTNGAAIPNRDSANVAIARRFYDATNTLLQTGRAAELEGVLASDFVDHVERVDFAPTGQGLVRYLEGLRASFPALRLFAKDVIAQGDRVAVRVRVEGADEGMHLGMHIHDGPAVWGEFDTFRVVDGRLAEHWGGSDSFVVLEPLFRTQLSARASPPTGVETPPLVTARVRRLHVDPGVGAEAMAEAETILLLEEGRLIARVTSPVGGVPVDAAGETRQDASPATRESNLGRGELLTLPAGAMFALRNDGDVPAVALAISVGEDFFPAVAPSNPPQSGSATAPAGLDGVKETLAEADWKVLLPAGRLVAEAGRSTLPPGGSLVVEPTAGLALLVVERGTLMVDGGRARGVRAVETLPAARSTRLHNTGTDPLTLLIFTVNAESRGDAVSTSL